MENRRPIALVVAVAENGVIGRDQALPWHLPSELKRFRALTWGKPVVMGRRTFESIGRPLPGRISIVITADPAFAVPEGVRKASDLASALEMAEAAADELGAGEIMVIGGRRVFAEALPLARTIHLTRVHGSPAGEVVFPELDMAAWRVAGREGPIQGPRDELPYSCLTLERVADEATADRAAA